MARNHKKKLGGAITEEEAEERIRKFFDQNYDVLRQEGGHVLAESGKRHALEQVLLYWRKLKTIAASVTETEVKLALPGLTTPGGRPFVIEGVVDIVREGDKVLMYDVKTHEERDVRASQHLYQDQLNVYAHIWKKLRAQALDGTAIIATRLPTELRIALKSRDPNAIRGAIDAWQPVVDLPFDEEDVQRTIADFAQCVDEIEDGKFSPPPPEVLAQPHGARGRKDRDKNAKAQPRAEPSFAQVHCANCDARFSCASYRTHLKNQNRASQGRRGLPMQEDPAEAELDAWIEENLSDE
jgi:hypothetical protein